MVLLIKYVRDQWALFFNKSHAVAMIKNDEYNLVNVLPQTLNNFQIDKINWFFRNVREAMKKIGASSPWKWSIFGWLIDWSNKWLRIRLTFGIVNEANEHCSHTFYQGVFYFMTLIIAFRIDYTFILNICPYFEHFVMKLGWILTYYIRIVLSHFFLFFHWEGQNWNINYFLLLQLSEAIFLLYIRVWL